MTLEVEEAAVRITLEYPAYGQVRAANELKKNGILISGGGVRSIWQRHDLETFKKRLNVLEEKAAKKASCTRKNRSSLSREDVRNVKKVWRRSNPSILVILSLRTRIMSGISSE